MIGTRHCRKCNGTMAVAGGVGHTRCPHCNCWMPTSESWTPLLYGVLVLAGAAVVLYAALR